MNEKIKKYFIISACLLICSTVSLTAQRAIETYTSDFGTLTLSQSGRTITGTYDYRNGRVEGILNGTILTGKWYQDNGEGKIRFVFSPDFSSFEGLWSYNEAEPDSPWNGKRTSTGGGIGSQDRPQIQQRLLLPGTYATDFGELTVTQSGSIVTGTYDYRSGRVEGTLTGTILTGRWYQDNGEGKFRFVFSQDFSSFDGLWSYNEAEPDSPWNGVKTSSASLAEILVEPAIQQSAQSNTKTQPQTALRLPIPGIYSSDFGTLTLSQSGRTVTGTYDHRNGRVEGILTGTVLTGKWYQDNGEGKFRFVFRPDFSSFEGLWSYDEADPDSPWNGTRK
ncbi:MAG: hypothetical protein K9L21_04245 [Spirochaetia bacterium]|nr:hypothetical protein [Spirochaetia bacterium]